jgi:hypothetical protein
MFTRIKKALFLATFLLFLIPSNNATAQTYCFPTDGCTGIPTVPTYGQLLVGNGSGTYSLMATSSLGISGSSGGDFPFTATSYGVSTSTTVGFLNGLFSTASSTFSHLLWGNATGTNATTTNLFSTLGNFTNLNATTATTTGNTIFSLTSSNSYVAIGTGTPPQYSIGGPSTIAPALTVMDNSDPITNWNVAGAKTFYSAIQAAGNSQGGADGLDTATIFGFASTTQNAYDRFSAAVAGVSLGSVGSVSTPGPTLSAAVYANQRGTFTAGINLNYAIYSTGGNNYFGGSTLFNASTTLQNFTFVRATGTAATTTNLAVSSLSSALLQSNGSGTFEEYVGTSCTNQFVRSLSALGVASCATVGSADVSLANLTATDSTLTFSGTYTGATARTIGLNLSNANTWTGAQIFGNATSTNLFSTIASSTNLQTSILGVASSTPFSALSVGAGKSITVGENRLATSTSMTVDWNAGNQQLIQKGTAGITLTFSNVIDGQKLTLVGCNPGAGTAGTFTWPSNVFWPGSTAPTQTTTANKCDLYTFLATKATSTTAIVIFGGYNQNY